MGVAVRAAARSRVAASAIEALARALMTQNVIGTDRRSCRPMDRRAEAAAVSAIASGSRHSSMRAIGYRMVHSLFVFAGGRARVDVINLACEVVIVADRMLPIAPLPKPALALREFAPAARLVAWQAT